MNRTPMPVDPMEFNTERLALRCWQDRHRAPFAALNNMPSVAVVRRIGMHNANSDFEHPALPEGHALRLRCLYKITRQEWALLDA